MFFSSVHWKELFKLIWIFLIYLTTLRNGGCQHFEENQWLKKYWNLKKVFFMQIKRSYCFVSASISLSLSRNQLSGSLSQIGCTLQGKQCNTLWLDPSVTSEISSTLPGQGVLQLICSCVDRLYTGIETRTFRVEGERCVHK
jgi:hypothetical protein